MDDAEILWSAFQADPAGTYDAIGQQLAEAGLINQFDPSAMLTPAEVEQWRQQRELEAYDAQVAKIVEANPDIDPNLFHSHVAAADGDFQTAVELYRANTAGVLARYGSAGAEQPAPSREYRGMQGLHSAIDDAVAEMRRRRQ